MLSLTCSGFPLILGAEFHFLVKPEQHFCLKQSCCAHLPSTFRSPLGGPQERPGDLRTDGAWPSALEGVHPRRDSEAARKLLIVRLLLIICAQ